MFRRPRTLSSLLVAIALPTLLFVMLRSWAHHAAAVTGEIVDFPIYRGDGVHIIAARCERSRLISNRYFFVLWASFTGRSRKLRAGIHRLKTGYSAERILVELASGHSARTFTVREGWTIGDIGKRLVAEGWFKNDNGWVRAATRPRRIAGEWLQTGAEGFCFPAAYQLVPSPDPEWMVQLMTSEFERRWLRLTQGLSAETTTGKVSRTVILASMIERETNIAAERPIIAAIFIRRLRVGMKLESCATVRYATGNWKEPISRVNLAHESPYNTYLHPGLPAGPICSPGESALRAALYPANTDYLFFVWQSAGRHVFSRTYKEHLKAARGNEAIGFGSQRRVRVKPSLSTQ